jgi:hypothetical protein
MEIEGQGPRDYRKLLVISPAPDVAETKSLKLNKNNKYKVTLHHTGTRPDMLPTVWYCWEAQVGGKPSEQTFASYSSVREPGVAEFFTIADGSWLVDNRSGLFTTHNHRYDTSGGNAAAGLESFLLPVEVVDKDKNPISKLKVGKMSEAGVLSETGATATLDIEKDSDRFFVRVKGGASLGGISVKFSTTGNPDTAYNDNATQIDLVADSADAISKSMLLVSDDVDDDYPVDGTADDATGDRTHKIQLGGNFKIEEIKIGTGAWQTMDAKTPVPVEKTTSFSVVLLRQTAGSAAVITQAAVESDLKLCQERYSTVGVKLSWTITTADPPAGVNLSNGLTEFSSNTPTIEEKALMDGLGTPSTSDFHVFYVNSLSNGSLGEAFPPSYFSQAADQKYTNNVIIPANRSFFAPPHELGHIYLNDGSHPPDRINLMTDQQAAMTNIITGDKRISPAQGTTIRSHPLIK